MNSVQLTRHRFHGDWNYTIRRVTSTGDYSYFLTGLLQRI